MQIIWNATTEPRIQSGHDEIAFFPKVPKSTEVGLSGGRSRWKPVRRKPDNVALSVLNGWILRSHIGRKCTCSTNGCYALCQRHVRRWSSCWIQWSSRGMWALCAWLTLSQRKPLSRSSGSEMSPDWYSVAKCSWRMPVLCSVVYCLLYELWFIVIVILCMDYFNLIIVLTETSAITFLQTNFHTNHSHFD